MVIGNVAIAGSNTLTFAKPTAFEIKFLYQGSLPATATLEMEYPTDVTVVSTLACTFTLLANTKTLPCVHTGRLISMKDTTASVTDLTSSTSFLAIKVTGF
jgi:hypothetical protein